MAIPKSSSVKQKAQAVKSCRGKKKAGLDPSRCVPIDEADEEPVAF